MRWLLLCLLAMACEAVEVQLLAPTQVVPNAPFQCTLVVTNATHDVVRIQEPPAQDGVALTRTGGASRETSIVNGAVTKKISFTMLGMVDRDVGAVSLPSVVVHFADGRELKTEPVVVTVTTGDQRLTGIAYAEVHFTPARVVPGQVTELQYDFFVPPQRDLALGASTVEPPSAASSVVELPSQDGRAIAADGSMWLHKRLRWQCTFIKPGTYQVGGQQALLVRRLIGARKLGDVPVTPGTVTVADFPAAGRPKDFKGLIGPLAMQIAIDRDAVPLGEGTILRLTVTGPDLSLLARPTLPVDPTYRVHPLEEQDVDGGRSFSWNLAPVREGQVTIGGLSLPFYDPAEGRYRRADSGTVTMTVLPGRRQALTVAGTTTPHGSGATLAAGPALILPEPLRGSGGTPMPAWLPLVAILAGLGCGLALGVGRWWSQRTPSEHRGRELARAIAAGDWEAADRVLHRLRSDCPDALRVDLDAGLAAIEQARFGGAVIDAAVREQLARLEHLS